MHVGWPQGFWLAMVAARLLIYAGKDGEVRTDKYQFGIALLSAAISFGLVYWGGFFS